MKFYVTHVGTDREVMVTREHNGTVLYLSHVIAKSEPLRYPVETGEAVCRALTAAPFMFEEARWIQRKQDQTPTGKAMSMFHAPRRHDPSYAADRPVYAPAPAFMKAVPLRSVTAHEYVGAGTAFDIR